MNGRGIKRVAEIEREARPVVGKMSKASILEAYRDLFIQVFGEDAGKATKYLDEDPIRWAHDLVTRAEYIKLARRRDDAERGQERNAERAAEAVFERE